jgi:hypothetical protein
MGSDAPAWAAQRPKQAKRNRDAELQRRRQERIEQRERDRKEREALRRAPPAEPPPPPAIAEPLRRWAQSEQGVVTVSHDGAITLTMWTAGGSKLEARFPSTTSALEALVAGAIDWRAAAPKPRSQRPGGVRPLVVEAAP